MKIQDVRYEHYGRDVYVLGSGRSMDFIPGDFFENKPVIGVNWMWKFRDCDWILIHHHKLLPFFPKWIQKKTFVSEYGRGVKKPNGIVKEPVKYQSDKYDCIEYYHLMQKYFSIDYSVLDDEALLKKGYLLMGGNTIIPAIGLAYYMGAKNIILCGCDGGVIDGKANMQDYNREKDRFDNCPRDKYYANGFGHSCRSLCLNMELRTELKKRDVNLLSISPFLDMACENHEFKSGEGLNEVSIEKYENNTLSSNSKGKLSG